MQGSVRGRVKEVIAPNKIRARSIADGEQVGVTVSAFAQLEFTMLLEPPSGNPVIQLLRLGATASQCIGTGAGRGAEREGSLLSERTHLEPLSSCM